MFGFEGTNCYLQEWPSGSVGLSVALSRRRSSVRVRSGSLKDFNPCGVLAQLGEHLPYKQRVIGSSPIGPISSENGFKCYANVTQFMTIEE